MRRPVLFGLLAVVLLSIVASFLLKPPKPIIDLKAETLFTLGPVVITNTILTSWIVIIFIIVVARLATRRMEMVPKGLQNVFEAVLEGLQSLIFTVAGEKSGRRFFIPI